MHSNTKARLFLSLAAAAALTGAVLALRRKLMLAAYRREIQEKTASLKEADGWTADGYIKNQDHFYHYTYRRSRPAATAAAPWRPSTCGATPGRPSALRTCCWKWTACTGAALPGPPTCG